jgi:hypothetical protein
VVSTASRSTFQGWNRKAVTVATICAPPLHFASIHLTRVEKIFVLVGRAPAGAPEAGDGRRGQPGKLGLSTADKRA